jgi:hypothetical protein
MVTPMSTSDGPHDYHLNVSALFELRRLVPKIVFARKYSHHEHQGNAYCI